MVKIKSMILISIFLAAALIPLMGYSAETTDDPPVRGGLNDCFDLDLPSSSSVLYPGQTDDFRIRLYNTYDGSGYGGSSNPGNQSTLNAVMVSFIGVFDDEMDPVPFDPFSWLTEEIYNNNGYGYTVSQYNYQTFYADASSSYHEIMVHTNNVEPGIYYLGFQQDFLYMTDWDGGTQFSWDYGSNEDFFQLEVRSPIGPYNNGEYTFTAMRESHSSDDLFSGAQNKLFGLRNLYPLSGSITEVYATISFPTLDIDVPNPTVYNPVLTSTIAWRINVPAETPPGPHPVELRFSYEHNGVRINESASMQEFDVLYTPILDPPPFDDLSNPLMTLTQKSMPDTIEVPFTNGGNVDLQDITVRLDLDNTKYVDGTNFFIDESGNGAIRWEDVTFELGDLAVGESATATFGTINFFPRLPPGLYKVPIDYIGTYHDAGATGNPSGDVITGYWDEMGYTQHHNIKFRTTYPENPYITYRPFVLIEVEDDPDGLDISGYIDSGRDQDPGNANSYMRLRVENRELYRFKDLTYTIHTDGGSPFEHPTSEDNITGDTLLPIYRSNLNAGSTTGIGYDSFYFYASVRQDANPGINYFRVDMTGMNDYNQPVSKSFYAHINIRAKQPRFEDMSTEVGNISDDRIVPVTAHFVNVGLGGVTNLTAFYISSSTGFTNVDPPLYIGDVPAGGFFDYTFHVKPDSDSRYMHGGYSGNVYFSYYDGIGKFTELMSGTNTQVRFDVYTKLPDLRIVEVNAPVIDRGDTITVEITVMNFGGSTAENLQAVLPYSYAYFTVEEGIKDLGDLDRDETVTFTWEIEGGDEFSDGSTYSFTIYFSYKDVEGRTRIFSEGESESFTLRTKDRIIPSEQRQVVKDDGVLISEGAGSVLLGILIIIGLIIFGSMIAKGHTAHPVEEKKAVPAKKSAPKLTLDEDEDEDIDEDEEEEEEEEDEDEEEEGDW